MDSNKDKPTVRYRVKFVSFFRPSSPSLVHSSSEGNAMVNSWTIMEAVIYGVIESAKIENFSKPTPVKAFRKPNASLPVPAK